MSVCVCHYWHLRESGFPQLSQISLDVACWFLSPVHAKVHIIVSQPLLSKTVVFKRILLLSCSINVSHHFSPVMYQEVRFIYI